VVLDAFVATGLEPPPPQAVRATDATRENVKMPLYFMFIFAFYLIGNAVLPGLTTVQPFHSFMIFLD
jgi:hypothetical protein